MSGCPKQTFTGITQERFECVCQKAASLGVTIESLQGETTQQGITLAWNYDPASATLELECLDSPFFISCKQIASQIQNMIDAC